MPLTWSRTCNLRSVFCFIFVDSLQFARGGSTEQRAAAAYELLLAIFPGVGPGYFLPMVFLVFGIRFQNGAKECIV